MTVLVMGGSQGASGINQAMIKALPFLRGASVQVIHLSGARDERLVSDNYRRGDVPPRLASLPHRKEETYNAPHLVVAPAGAACPAEVAAPFLPRLPLSFSS